MKQSPNDPKQYQAITLNNGLRVLLIHNIETTKSAAALAVNAGHFNDPKDRQGLAHFLEHMLFLGTKNFPDGSEYQKFINQHGGNHNAWTGTEHTCFFFDIASSHFSAALERFSEFFIAPLLSDDFVVKERENIDAEFTLKLKDDIRRLYDVHKDTINPKHPFSQFSVGNLDTLADRAGVNISTEIKAFFKRYYCAQYMTLALEGPQSLLELKSLAEQGFSNVRSTKKALPTIKPALYLAKNQKIKIDICPVKNDHQLILSFAMESIDRYYQDKPESILAYLLGHEGEGSILSLLKKHQWALGLTAGSGINGSNFKDFNISIALTELGEAHLDDIIDIVFAYIALLKNNKIAEYYYQEKQNICNLAFLYHEKMRPLDSVSQLVINMQYYPQEDYIYGDYVMQGMSHNNISRLLDYLHADNMRIMHVSQNNHFSQNSFWYQVPYHVTRISPKKLAKWRTTDWHAANSNNELAHTKGLYLPEPNPYIIESPVLYSNAEKTSSVKKTPLVPKKIVDKNGLIAWYKKDQTFNVPKGYLYIGIDSPYVVASVANTAMTRLFVDLYTDTVIEENYGAELAGIHYHLYSHQGGVTLQLSGYSENQHILLTKLLNRLQSHQVTEKHFNLFKKQLVKHWLNSDKSKSISQLFSTLSSVMQPNNPTSKALAAALDKVSFSEYQVFSQQLFLQVTLEVLIHGNWLTEHAMQLCNTIEQAFQGKVNEKYAIQCPVTNIAKKETLLLPISLPEHDHACVIYVSLEHKDDRSIALAMVTSHILSPLFFQKMRTEKQYGYLVGVGYVPINNYPGIALYIQSPHCDAYQLATAMDSFINEVLLELDNISTEQWQHLQQGLASQLQEVDNNLRIRSQRFWGAICNKDITFKKKENLLQTLLTLDLAQIKTFVKSHLIPNCKPDRFILYSQTDELEQEQQPKGNIINDIDEFIKESSLKY
ncbi:insulinase family protein [Colwellia sp. E2M01]|uniref:insulinase family protein n=1 Tax=Colwellia sp. E2M01 TaxID=2841561 RepID=UPI001C090F49|nr:insulinase family protein [Colwellia sp. E2M01]MBU2871255.1 insulinase family protein [Colwellia sp. E2M01]